VVAAVFVVFGEEGRRSGAEVDGGGGDAALDDGLADVQEVVEEVDVLPAEAE